MEKAHITPGSIVVGIDGSEHSDRAVRWAARQAAAEHRPLVLLHAVGLVGFQSPAWLGAYGIDPTEAREQLLLQGRSLLTSAAHLAGSERRGLDVREILEISDPRTALLDASRTAATVVIGPRGIGPVRSLLLGSTSSAVCLAASCPVVVVPPETGDQQRHGIVVGADGTAESVSVIEFAIRQASLMGRPVTVMHAFWDVAGELLHGRHVSPDERGLEDLRVLLAASVAGMREKFPDVEIRLELARGLVDECLAATGATAELVVVGRRRRGALSRLISSTVTAAVLEHAHCPVAVVPQDESRPSS